MPDKDVQKENGKGGSSNGNHFHPLISLILSFRNEQENIPELINRLQAMFSKLSVDHELIFVNDNSSDDSLNILRKRAHEDHRIKVLNMSRRFGVAECVFAGMRHSSGDAVIMMDTDLQDPPEVIPQMVDKWLQEKADVVYTVRTKREGESAIKLILTRWAYKIIKLTANINLPVEAGDFKLLDRRVVNELIRLNEKDPYLRGLVTWLGFKQVPVYYKREGRFKGETHFPIFASKGPILTFITGLTSFSVMPLSFFLGLGLLVMTGSLATLGVMGVMELLGYSWPGGSAVVLAMFFLSGVQLTGIGTLGVYLGRVYNDVRNRPRYIVDSTMNFDGWEPVPDFEAFPHAHAAKRKSYRTDGNRAGDFSVSPNSQPHPESKGVGS